MLQEREDSMQRMEVEHKIEQIGSAIYAVLTASKKYNPHGTEAELSACSVMVNEMTRRAKEHFYDPLLCARVFLCLCEYDKEQGAGFFQRFTQRSESKKIYTALETYTSYTGALVDVSRLDLFPKPPRRYVLPLPRNHVFKSPEEIHTQLLEIENLKPGEKLKNILIKHEFTFTEKGSLDIRQFERLSPTITPAPAARHS